MTSGTAQEEMAPILACTVCRDVQNFDLLITDMEDVMGEQWGDLTLSDALVFLEQPDAEQLEFIALALDDMDEDNLDHLMRIITSASDKGIKTILVAEDVTPASLHQLLRHGAHEFVPYPLPDGELEAAVERIRRKPEPLVLQAGTDVGVSLNATSQRNGVLMAVHGIAGGTGATTLAVNLAYELATIDKNEPPKVCIIDLDLQFGSVSTFLDLERKDAVFELLSDTEDMDHDAFAQALQSVEDNLQVLTAPPDILPLDILQPDDIERVLDMARAHFDYVIVDMPSTLVQWTETVLTKSHVYFSTVEIDMRSAQNAMRMKRALQAEELPFEKIRFILNRGPKFTDLTGKARIKRMAEGVGISIDVVLPDGQKPVMQASDHGTPLAQSAPKNPLRREIAKLAKDLHELGQSEEQAA